MALRPVAFSIPSTTELKITFSQPISERISKENFEVESLNGSVSNLDIISVLIKGPVLIVKTRPQVSGNYYLLKLIDATDVIFASEKGVRLLDDSTSRTLFFVGIDKINPIRDRALREVPQLYDVSNTTLKNIISAQAEEMFKAQTAIGRAFSNNYISVDVEDEFRTRGPGATDRMANENAYDVIRIAKTPTATSSKYGMLDYTSNNAYELTREFPYFEVSLQETLIEDEEISSSSSMNSFNGFLLTLSKSNVIRILSVKYIGENDVADCDGNIGTEYNLDVYKYTILNNQFDKKNAFSFSRLSNSNVLLSEFGNIPRPSSGDIIKVSYLYKDLGKNIIGDSVSVSKIIEKENESVPSSSISFFLNKAPIVDKYNKIYSSKGGISFKTNENSANTPPEFSIELLYGSSRTPSSPGEYTVNYKTGEVFVIGTTIGDGTGRNSYVMDYKYRKEFIKDVDYSVYKQSIVGHSYRGLVGEEAEVSFSYDQVLAEGVDFKVSSHIEVMSEQVENKLSGSFSIRTDNAPITDVFRILNQTTGEVYNPLYHSDTEAYFSGNRSPEIISIQSESVKFDKIVNEELEVIGRFVIPSFEIRITSNVSNNSIFFEPGIPAELISFNSDDYYVRVTDSSDPDSIEAEDLKIKFFGDPDSNNLINSFAINTGLIPPSKNVTASVGTIAYQVYLSKEGVLNKNLDAVGSFINKSISFSNSSVFENEKYFKPVASTSGIDNIDADGISKAFTALKTTDFYTNISRLRKVGDYSVDYQNGIVYVAIDSEQDLNIGKASYYYNGVVTKNSNIFNATGASKKFNSPDLIQDATEIYSNLLSDTKIINIQDLENTLGVWDGESRSGDLDGEFKTIFEVLDDYTVVLPHNISNILSINKISSLTGSGLNSIYAANRVSDSSVSNLLTTIASGGKNIYDQNSVSYTKNVIDLKTSKKRRVYLDGNGNLSVTIYDNSIEEFYSAKVVKTDLELFDDKLNITKLSGVKILESEEFDSGHQTVYIYHDDIDDIDESKDFLLDSDGNRFLITEVDTTLSTILIEIPAVNNSESNSPAMDYSGSDSKIVVKPLITIGSESINISIPSDAPVNSGDLIEFTYISSAVPEVGTPLAIDYRYGSIYVDYTFVKDRLLISYEYGDNSIDWSINDSLSEGDSYYISYKYGAGREALRSNFGSLTGIPFFDTFPLNVDRELYRSAVAGTLQTFPKGPTNPAFKELVKSFTEINPNIDEIVFGNWILGRDYLHVGKPEVNGDLVFMGGKFNDGLLFNSGTTVSIPAISSLSLEEGTVEGWVRPSWSGIDNDADITVSINNIGDEKYFTEPKDKLFSKGWDLNDSDAIGGIDDTGLGFRLFNHISDEEEISGMKIGQFLLKNVMEDYNEATDSSQKIRVKVPYAAIRYGVSSGIYELKQNFKVLTFGMSDGTKVIGGEFNLTRLLDLDLESNYSVTSVDLPNYERPHYLRSCKCSVLNNVEILEKFNSELIEIDLDSKINISSELDKFLNIDNGPESMVLVDETGTHWRVKAFTDNDRILTTNRIPSNIRKIYIERFPINDRHLSGMDVDSINESLPSGAFNLYLKTFRADTGSITDSNSVFDIKENSIVNWSNYVDIKIEKVLKNNLVNIKIKNAEFSLFYHEFVDVNDTKFSGVNQLSNGSIMGMLQSDVYVDAQFFRNRITVSNRYSLSDIYIGQNGYNPSSKVFTINKEDEAMSAMGIPQNIDSSDGVFIGFDELCKSPLSDKAGQWVFRTRATRGVEIPESVTIIGDSYSSNFTTYEIDYKFSGTITTDGEFSSVEKGFRDIDNKYIDNVNCNSHFRYSGENLLESSGWVNLEEVGSDLINTILGGRETFYHPWIKVGDFETSASDGIYRVTSGINDTCDDNNGNYLYSKITCDSNIELKNSLRVASISDDIISYGLGEFSGAVSGSMIGITPIGLINSNKNIKLTLGMTNSDEALLILFDGIENRIVDYISYNWNDNNYHEYKIIKDLALGTIKLYADDILLSQVLLSEFAESSDELNDSFEVHIADRDILDMSLFLENDTEYIVDIDLIEYSGNNLNSGEQLESTDILISTDSKIEFEFNIDPLDGYDQYDGYDGYIEAVTGTDEIYFSADRAKYFIDSAADDHSGRISIFKDGKGFLNFRVYDDSLKRGSEVGMYNLATNIKSWVAGELHHIAASWKFNSIDERDEMHLFVDGVEAPNIYKFGGTVPLVVNAKFSDVSKEALHNFMTNDVEFCDTYEDGVVVADSSVFSCSNLTFTEDMIGRSILITESIVGENLIGGEYIIKSVVGGSAIFGTGSSMENVVFSVSASDIKFKFPPTSGILTPVLTDLRNSNFTIYHTLSNGVIEELGGITYEVLNGEIDIISGSNIDNPKYRANLDTRIIEFVGRSDECITSETVSLSDLDVHIETFGLNLQRCNQLLDLSSSSYITDGSKYSGKSIIRLYGQEPLSLSDVDITRIIMDKTVLEIGSVESRTDDNYLSQFSITLNTESKRVSSESGRVSRQNLGRLINLWYDSDNTVFSKSNSEYDGYSVSGENIITVYGSTIDGSNEETFVVNKNGFFSGEKYFKTVDRIEGTIIIADPDYFELGMVSIEELNKITVPNNNGDYAEVYGFENGTYTLSTVGSNGLFPFELHKGKYKIEYPAYLRLSIPTIGRRLYIGSDHHESLSWGGVIDEFRIISEMSNDTRSYEVYTSGTRSITKDFNTTDVFCADEQTLALIHFDNPIEKQSRKLRTKKYLDEYNNVKFGLSIEQREELLSLAGKKDSFISSMINMGFKEKEATITFYEVIYAENGPVINDAEYYNNFNETKVSSESVNSSFGKSGYFKSGEGLLYNNDSGYFRSSEGTIEFWVSPVIDTRIDSKRRHYIDIADITRERMLSRSSSIIDLNSSASKVISIKLMTAAARYESFYSSDDADTILFDEIARSDISGRLEGGTGTDKDFGVGAKLSADGKSILLSDALPGQNIDVIVTYIPIDSSGDRISIFKNENSQIVFGITADGTEHVVSSDVNWKKNTWHRIMCMYKTGTKSNDTMRIFVDGEEGGIIKYGTGLIYGTGYVYGQHIKKSGQAKSKDYRIELGSDFKMVSVGSDIYGDNSSRARMDNLRFSNSMRNASKDSLGNFIDANYSSNTETIYPVIKDDYTTFILNFDADGERIDKFATVIDPVNGIFDFDIEVVDNFNKVIGINNGEIEDLIVDLVNRLKPAHSNALVKFSKNKC